MDLIRNEDVVSIENLIPIIVTKAAQLENIYQQIDKLEELVKMVKANVDQFEIEVNKAEELFSNQNRVKKFFNSWLINKKQSKVKKTPNYNSPLIFNYDQYVNRSCEDSKQKSQQTNCDIKHRSVATHLNINSSSTSTLNLNGSTNHTSDQLSFQS